MPAKKEMTIDDSNILERYEEMFAYYVNTGEASWLNEKSEEITPR